MPAADAVAAPAAGDQPGQQRQQAAGGGLLAMIVRMAMMYYFMQWMKGSQQPGGAGGTAPGQSHPIYRRGDLVDMYMYLSEQPFLSSRSDAILVWKEADIALGVSPERSINYTYHPSPAVQGNGSLYLHAYFIRSGYDIDSPLEELPADSIFSRSHNLVAYLPKPKNKTGVNLLDKSNKEVAEPVVADAGPREIISFLRPNATLAIVDQFQPYPRAGLPPQLAPLFQYNDEGNHYPLAYWNDFWLLRDKYVPMNSSVEEVQLALHVRPINFWWMQLQSQMEASFQMQVNMGIAQDGESDEMKRVFIEGNPVLLAITMVVSMLHSVFDFLAFKNDVTFWKENKSMEGLSARSIMINAVCQAIIFFYLLDNETSMVVLFSSGVGTLIEFWKVTKAFDVTTLNTFPFVSIKDKASYDRHDTKRHDADAIRMLSYVLYPLIIGYSIYSLMYENHKSWYSWVLGSLVGAVYTFGFILMCPQLYLNYKLKSVAHLPWRQMTYKFLNTIIDDLFAFVIKMPLLHRLSVFRDDVIFCIFLYQRWIYRVDPTRVNEFGFSAVDAAGGADGQVADGEATALLEGSEAAAAAPSEGRAGQKVASSRRQDAAARQLAVADDTPAAGTSEDDDDDAPAAAAARKQSRRKKA